MDRLEDIVLQILSFLGVASITFFLCYFTSWKLILLIWIIFFIMYVIYLIIYRVKIKKVSKTRKIKRETLTMSNAEAVKKRKKYKH